MGPGTLHGVQILLILGEALFVSVLFVVCFRVRPWLGLAPLYAMTGVIYYLASFLAGTVYIQVAPSIVVSPGSVAYFPALLFVVLAIYIVEDALEARRLISGLLATNVFLAMTGYLTALHLQLPGVINPFHLPASLFVTQPRILTVSLLAMFADTLLIIIVYEVSSRFVPSLFARIYLSIGLTLAFDTVLFVTGIAFERPIYAQILTSEIFGKLVVGLIYAGVLTVYLRWFALQATIDAGEAPVSATIRVLTYRERFDVLQAHTNKDTLTGLYNRAFLDEILESQTSISLRSGRTLSILMADIDFFKTVNDSQGHAAGDRVLHAVGATLTRTFRSADYVCRYGGEEFVVVLPNTDFENARQLADRARQAVADRVNVTITIGVAMLRDDGFTHEELLAAADRRLYEGKELGRNMVVSEAPDLTATA
ncbi:MAG: diguanylate cyclase, partial [Vulcanimicrobiaceae bacterium]